jgi:Flp pilus assembly protein TadD
VEDVRTLYSAALDRMSEGRLDEAAELMEGILKRDPAFLDAYEGLAMLEARRGNPDRAIVLLEELAGKDPANVMAHANLSVLYLRKGEKQRAEEEKAKATVLQFRKRTPGPGA